MTAPAPVRAIVLRIRFDTLVLVASAAVLALGVAHAARERAPGPTPSAVRAQPAWTGRIADVSANDESAAGSTMTSASLVVPPSALALPVAPRAATRTHACEGTACATKAAPTIAPVRPQRPSTMVASLEAERRSGTDLIGKLNPLNHVPDVVRHPFEVAGNTISGWFKRP